MTGLARLTSLAGLALVGPALAGLALLVGATEVSAQAPAGRPGTDTLGGPWGRMEVAPGSPVDMRPFPPKAGRKRCVAMHGIAGAQMFGDSALELTMKNGQRYRLFFARECPALSFYQGFYYRRSKAGMLCAGRDAIGARSGGECAIASIIQVYNPKK